MTSPVGARFVPVSLVASAAIGMVIAVWLSASAMGWDENRVVSWIPESTWIAALVIVALIVADAILPIPATLLMLGSGALLGPVTGALVNAVGLLLAALVGYGIGRMAGAQSRRQWLPSESTRPLVMVATTRGLPVLSESVAIGAGVLRFPVNGFAGATAVGALSVGIVYAVAGAAATDHWALAIVAAGVATLGYLITKGVMFQVGDP
ncbi:MAG: TVP38/TMEM64 family protein [Acidimicrobiales bacterium]